MQKKINVCFSATDYRNRPTKNVYEYALHVLHAVSLNDRKSRVTTQLRFREPPLKMTIDSLAEYFLVDFQLSYRQAFAVLREYNVLQHKSLNACRVDRIAVKAVYSNLIVSYTIAHRCPAVNCRLGIRS